jgi:hypothetical protein
MKINTAMVLLFSLIVVLGQARPSAHSKGRKISDTDNANIGELKRSQFHPQTKNYCVVFDFIKIMISKMSH